MAVLLPLYAPITQAGWNPARDFGPRIVAALGGWGEVAIPGPSHSALHLIRQLDVSLDVSSFFSLGNGFWIYIVGPCFGAPLGALLAEVLWR